MDKLSGKVPFILLALRVMVLIVHELVDTDVQVIPCHLWAHGLLTIILPVELEAVVKFQGIPYNV